MSWNHRVVYHKEDTDEYTEEYLSIHEVYYDDNHKPTRMTEQPVNILSVDREDGLTEIKWTLEQMLKAIEKPILDYETLEEIEKEKQDDFSKSLKKEE